MLNFILPKVWAVFRSISVKIDDTLEKLCFGIVEIFGNWGFLKPVLANLLTTLLMYFRVKAGS